MRELQLWFPAIAFLPFSATFCTALLIVCEAGFGFLTVTCVKTCSQGEPSCHVFPATSPVSQWVFGVGRLW